MKREILEVKKKKNWPYVRTYRLWGRGSGGEVEGSFLILFQAKMAARLIQFDQIFNAIFSSLRKEMISF